MSKFKPLAGLFVGVLLCKFIMLSACTSESNHNENLDSAQASIENNDYRMARSICDDVYSKELKSESKDAKVMARLALLYMKLADNSDAVDNIDYAYECYEQAYVLDSVKAHDYYMSLGVEDMPLVVLLESIVKNSKMYTDSLNVHPADSIELREIDLVD